MNPGEGDGPDAAASGALPTHVEAPSGRRRVGTEPNPVPAANVPSLSAFDPPPRRFELGGELGRGGMGRVDEAFDRALGRQVAIKHVLSTSPVDLARFEREARITARLEHPGIVPVHDAGRSADGTPYYVMRRVDGRPLDEIVDARAGDLAQRLALVPDVLAVCDAVGYAHARGVVHRDIKPTNILVGPFGETLLIDWGLARETATPDAADAGAPLAAPPDGDGQLTRAGAVAGTPGFMAPEQARGEHVDARADVFALGATLFHVLAGRPPYAADSATEMIDAARADRPPEWARIPRGVPADLLAIVHKAMASDAAARYPDAGAMAGDLRQFVTGKLVAAHAYGWGEQLLRFVRRHRGALAVGAIAVLLLAVGGVLSVRRIVDERDAADAARELAETRRRDTAALRDGLLVDRAKDLAKSDPIAAIALLRDLAPDSERWPQAYAAAAEAFYRGVPSGFELDASPVDSLRVSPDNTHVLAATSGGTVAVIDLAARSKRILSEGRRGAWCDYVFAGTRALCRASDNRIELIDVATAATVTLALPGLPSAAATDGAARAWVVVGHDLYELDLAQPAGPVPAPVLHDVQDIEYLHDAHRLLAVHQGVITIRGERGETWELPGAGRDVASVHDRTRVIIEAPGFGEVWDLAAAPTLVFRVPMSTGGFPIGLVADTVYATDGNAVISKHRDGRSATMATNLRLFGYTPGALVFSRSDGSLHIGDHAGQFELGPRPQQYSRLTMTDDSRYVAVGTDRGLVQWWEMWKIRPNPIALDEIENPFMLGRWLWTVRMPTRIVRYDLANGTFSSQSTSPISFVAVDPSERYVALATPTGPALYEFESGQLVYQGPAGAGWSFGLGGLVTMAEREISVFTLPAAHLEHVATLSEPGTFVVAQADCALVLTEHQACRITPGQPLDCAALPTPRVPSSLTIDAGGRVWLIVDGALYRWDRGGTWQPAVPEQRFLGLVANDDHAIAFGAASVIELRDPLTPLPVPQVGNPVAAHGVLVFANGQSTISIADLASGATFDVAARDHVGNQVVTDGHRVVYQPLISRPALDLITLSVPRERAALQAWLADITNARKTHDGIVSFP